MSIPKLLFPFVFSIILSAGLAQSGSVKNPLLVHNNQPIPFDKVGAAIIRDAVSGLVRISDNRIRNIINLSETETGAGSVLAAYDGLTYDLTDLEIKLALIAETYPGDSSRDAANNGILTIKPDFVEAPSQFLENFCWEYPSLKIFARHYKTGAVLPESLFQKLKSSEHVLDRLYYMQQLYYGIIDFTFHDKYDSIRGCDINQVSADLHPIVQYPFVEGTHFIASFGHLNGYAANYYGYLWSRVFAQDIFSVFGKNGVMDSKTGIRYRKDILEVAGSEEEMDMLCRFLGREPNADAFMKSIGL